MLFGIDAGNYETKVVTEYGAHKFLSVLGEWNERKVDVAQTYGANDIEFEYCGRKGFAGTLALEESRFQRKTAGDTKAHNDALLRILIAIHLYGNYERSHRIVVGQPIVNHAKDKAQMIDMIRGQHEITVNGETKRFEIADVAVAAEGAGVFLAYKGSATKLRIIDVGSGTVNCATISNGRFINRDSFTLNYGANTQDNYDVENLADSIVAETTKHWARGDEVMLCGGIAELVAPMVARYFVNAKVHRPMVREDGRTYRVQHPVFANAAGFYELARGLYGEGS